MKFGNKLTQIMAVWCCLITLAGCGGGDEREPVTLVYSMEFFEDDAAFREEEVAYRALQEQLKSRGIEPVAIQCGSLTEKDINLRTKFYVGLAEPRLFYYRFTAADADAVRDLGWYAEVDDAWRAFYLPPHDCGLQPSLE